MKLIASLALAVATLCSAASATTFNDLLVFGDSLSDTGNVYEATGMTFPPSPPYWMGRFSNGPVWCEVLAAELPIAGWTTASGHAYGGAQSGNRMPTDDPGRGGGGGLQTQVNFYLGQNPVVNPNALISVWAGGNDYIASATPPATRVETVIGNLETAVTNLANVGGKFFLVPDLPDLGTTPSGQAANAAELSAVTQLHNAELPVAMAQLAKDLDVTIWVPGVGALYEAAKDDPSQFGLTNVTGHCLENFPTICANPDEYLFWDDLHPTARGHVLIAGVVMQLLPPPAAALDTWTMY